MKSHYALLQVPLASGARILVFCCVDVSGPSERNSEPLCIKIKHYSVPIFVHSEPENARKRCRILTPSRLHNRPVQGLDRSPLFNRGNEVRVIKRASLLKMKAHIRQNQQPEIILCSRTSYLPPSPAMNTVPLEFIKNTRKQLLSLDESWPLQEKFSLLSSAWGIRKTDSVMYLGTILYFSLTSKSFWYNCFDNQMECFLALPDTSDFLIHRLKVYIIALDVGNESFRQVSEEGLLRIQKAMLKCDVPADVRLWVDGFSFLSAGAPVLRKLVNCFSRIEHFSAEQIDPFVQKIVFRSIEMGSLRSMVLTNAMLSEEILTRIIKWTRGREFQSLWISTPKEDQFGFDRRVILEIAKEFEQRRVKIMLTLHKSVWPRYSTFDDSEFIVKESQNWSLRRIQFDRL